jgi:hypothetical protein
VSSKSTHTINRRRFLRHAALLATGGLLAACALPSAQSLAGEPIEPNPRPVQLPLPQASKAGNDVPDEALEQFLALSVLLTGVDDLNPAIGRIYFDSLQQNSTLETPVSELLAQIADSAAAMPASLEALASTGLFDNEATRTLADTITEYWYTGVYDTPEGEQAVATFVEALAWTTLTFTKPMTVCGAYRFWTEPPESAID